MIEELKALIAKWEAEASSAISLLLSFFKEAITEEEAALFPQFKALAIQIFGDEVKMAGLNLDARVAVVVADFMAQLPVDIALAKKALINSWAWAVAKQQGIVDGNQGVVS
jgi:hypothetical protein